MESPEIINFQASAQNNTDQPEKRKTRERVRNKEKMLAVLAKEHLIVKDGYDWSSTETPNVLPTMFHGTSEYFLEDILKNGLKPEAVNLEAIEKEEPQIAKALRKTLEKSQQNIVSITTSFDIARSHAQKTPERYTNVAVDEHMSYRGKSPRERESPKIFGKWDLEYFPRNSEIRRLFLSVFNPRPVILSVRPHKEDIDPELIKRYDPRTKFFLDAEYRKEFLDKIKEQQFRLGQYLEEKKLRRGKTSFTLTEVTEMHSAIGGKFMGIPRNKSEVKMFMPGEIAEILFRNHFYEVPVKQIPPDRIITVNRIKIPKPQKNLEE